MDKPTRFVKDSDGQWWFILKSGARTRAAEQVCAQCGGSFVALYKRVTCSHKCAGLRKRKPPKPMKQCLQCGGDFRLEFGRQRFCSHPCAATWMHAQRPKTTQKDDTLLVNADNPRYTQDDSGQWWYLPVSYRGTPHSRTRASVAECARCGQRFLKTVYSKDVLHCSKRCGVQSAVEQGRKVGIGDKSHQWTGGRLERGGYVLVYAPDHHSVAGTSRRYVMEHRLVMEQKEGRPLKRHEQVHHVNGIRNDNRPENLELWAKQQPSGQRVHEQFSPHCPTCTCHLTKDA